MKNQLAELEQTEAQLLHAKSELDKIELKKKRAEEDFVLFKAEIDSKKRKLDNEFGKLRNQYELDISALPQILQDLEDQKEAVNQSIFDAIGELKLLQGDIETQTDVLEKIGEQKDLALVQIEDADRALEELESQIKDKTVIVKDIELAIENGTLVYESIKENALKVENELTDLRADLQTRKQAFEDDMKITIQKSTDVVKRLIELEKKENKINSDINARIKAVELREQVVARRESKIVGMEQKAQEYAKFMKL